MRVRQLIPLALIASATLACDGLLDVQPVDRISNEKAITDAASARAALTGAYAAMTDGDYYAGGLLFLGDLSADNAEHTGTLQSYADVGRNQLKADNGQIEGTWAALYDAINRANVVLRDVPGVPGLNAAQRADILGQAYFLRALHYHNLVKLWGDVPLVLAPPATLTEAAAVTRAPVADVYAQILEDLDSAAARLGAAPNSHTAGIGAVQALRSRVMLYQGDWAGAQTAAEAVGDLGYALAPSYSSLFEGDAATTPEDILRVVFTAVDYNIMGYYYIDQACGGGRGEIAPTADLQAAYDASDTRLDWTIQDSGGGNLCGTKYPTTIGAEDVLAIRYGEVLLNLAEAMAQQDDLDGAVDTYNRLRARAGAPQDTLGTQVTTKQDVLDAIWHERRVELALEGDRWPDLVRTGRATTVLSIPATQTLYPIPQSERAVAPNLTQNPGY